MFIPMDPQHFRLVRPQPRQQDADVSMKQALVLLEGGPAMACLNAQGFTIACAGLFELWHGRGLAWAILGGTIGRHMVEIVRAMRKNIDASSFHRVEMCLAPDNNPADIRLARLLGFHRECTAQKMLPDGRDADVWIWIRHS